MITITCVDCDKERQVERWRRDNPIRCITCSNKLRIGRRLTNETRQKMSHAMMGSNNPQWKGGVSKSHSAGYVRICLNPRDFFYPMTGNQNYTFEHRLVMAKSINRCLRPWEVVHHRNGIKHDNRLENLQLISGNKYHIVDSIVKVYIRKLETKIRYLEDEVESLRFHPKPREKPND